MDSDARTRAVNRTDDQDARREEESNGIRTLWMKRAADSKPYCIDILIGNLLGYGY